MVSSRPCLAERREQLHGAHLLLLFLTSFRVEGGRIAVLLMVSFLL